MFLACDKKNNKLNISCSRRPTRCRSSIPCIYSVSLRKRTERLALLDFLFMDQRWPVQTRHKQTYFDTHTQVCEDCTVLSVFTKMNLSLSVKKATCHTAVCENVSITPVTHLASSLDQSPMLHHPMSYFTIEISYCQIDHIKF